MIKKKFELFMCCLGNGITVCNKAVEVNGDYKQIAHISEHGIIKWYVKPENIPGDALLKIEHSANTQREKFIKWLDSISEIEQYSYLLDRVKHEDFMHVCKMSKNLTDKITYLRSKLYQSYD